MSIWQYQDVGFELLNKFDSTCCPFCNEKLISLFNKKFDYWGDQKFGLKSKSSNVLICQICGWWKALSTKIDVSDSGSELPLTVIQENGAFAILKNFNTRDINAPIADIRSFLLAKYESRFDIHPRLFENTVADVFRNLGYSTTITAYSSDGGIDVILQDNNGEIGIQVKRYRSTIMVEQIRALVGALVFRGYNRGIFVTTSKFSFGARNSIIEFSKRGYIIDLINSEKFFSALKITQRPMYNSLNEFQQLYNLDIENLPKLSITGLF